MRGLRGAVAANQFATRIRHTAHHHVIVLGKVFANNGAQFDLIAIAQKARQRRIDQERLGNLYRLLGIAPELMRLGLTDCDKTIGRQVIGRRELECSFAIRAGF